MERAMNMSIIDELEEEIEDFVETTSTVIPEASPATRLSRRRKIEDLFEEKRLQAELSDYF